jgi:tetratricopeptide (TPR) repeat protein
MNRVALLAILFTSLACGGASKKRTKSTAPAPLSQETYTHYLRGKLAYFQGNFSEAESEFAEAKRSSPGQAPISRALAEARYYAGNRRGAAAEMAWARAQWPKDAQVWMQSGDLHRSARDFALANIAYKRAIALGARDEATYLAYGTSLAEIGKREEAKAIFRKLIARKTNSAEAHYQLALLLHAEKRFRATSAHAREATTEAPYDLRAWALLSNALYLQGNGKEADNMLRRPFDRSQGTPSVGEQLFVQLLELGARKQALLSVKVLDRDDLPIDTRISMGHWLLRAGDFKGALAVASRLKKLPQASTAIVELRVRALRALHRNQEAENELKTIGPGDAGYPLMQAMLAHLFADTDNTAMAQTTVSSALEDYPDHPELIMAAAAVAETAGDIEKAREILKSAIAQHPLAQRPLFALAELESRNGRTKEAIAIITPILRANRQSFAALNYIGYSLISDPESQERAEDLLLRALELAPDSGFVLDSYGWFLLQSNKKEAAAPLIERAVRLSPTEPELLAHLAELRWAQGRQDEAKRLLQQARQLALAKHSRAAIDSLRNRLTQSMPSAKP